MKKLLVIIFALVLSLIGLSACGNGGKGKAPCIGENGNWWIGTQDTGVKAQAMNISISDDGYWVIDGVKTDKKTSCNCLAPEEENAEGFVFYLKDDGTYAVSGGYASLLSVIEIPATYKGRAVTEIADGAFCRFKNLKTLRIPDSINIIGDYAFYKCDNLEAVYLGRGIKTVGIYAFEFCASLEIIHIEEGSSIQCTFNHTDYNRDRWCDVCGLEVCVVHELDEDGYCKKCAYRMCVGKHIDLDHDLICDIVGCGEMVPCTNHADVNEDQKCDYCNGNYSGTNLPIIDVPLN